MIGTFDGGGIWTKNVNGCSEMLQVVFSDAQTSVPVIMDTGVIKFLSGSPYVIKGFENRFKSKRNKQGKQLQQA